MLTTNQEVTTVRPPLPTVAPLACLITYLSNNIFGVIDLNFFYWRVLAKNRNRKLKIRKRSDFENFQ